MHHSIWYSIRFPAVTLACKWIWPFSLSRLHAHTHKCTLLPILSHLHWVPLQKSRPLLPWQPYCSGGGYVCLCVWRVGVVTKRRGKVKLSRECLKSSEKVDELWEGWRRKEIKGEQTADKEAGDKSRLEHYRDNSLLKETREHRRLSLRTLCIFS